MKKKILNRKRYQDILYYIAGFYIFNEDVPKLQELADALSLTKQNAKGYMDSLIKEKYLFVIPNRAIRKYGINFNRLTQLREHNLNKALINLGLMESPTEQ